MKMVICEICKENIGKVDTRRLRLPLTGDQLKSVDQKHDMPPFFHPLLDWETMRCPYCKTRPILEPDRLMFEDRTYHKIKKELKKHGNDNRKRS